MTAFVRPRAVHPSRYIVTRSCSAVFEGLFNSKVFHLVVWNVLVVPFSVCKLSISDYLQRSPVKIENNHRGLILIPLFVYFDETCKDIW